MRLSDLDLLFWAAGLLGHVTLLCVFFLRHRAARFPFFTALISLEIARTALLYWTMHHGSDQTYFVSYWLFAIVDAILQICVVYEIASQVFRPVGRVWAPDIRRGAALLLVASLAIASALTWLAAPVATSWEQVLAIKGSFFSATLLSELFVGMVALSASAGLPWKTHAARIAQGLGAYSVLDILIEAGHTLYGVSYQNRIDLVLSYGRMCLYLLCLGFWIVKLWEEAPAPAELPSRVRRQLALLHERTAGDLLLLKGWRR